MTGYYDYVLGAIPGGLVGVTALLVVAGVDLSVAMPVGATVAALVAGHAVFVNGPVKGDAGATTGSTPDGSPVNAD
ncbi:hypothetical protein [Haloplanus salilacus]|uniref:hypothetical protein n=1 Tax=Haloplanus salilacus TaxID=2949994 RepID=UPI0030D4364F